MTDNLTLDEAIEALNDGKKVTHRIFDDNYLEKSRPVVEYGIEKGFDDILDPFHEKDTYYVEYICGVNVYNKDGERIGYNPRAYWKNGENKRVFPLEGWKIIEELDKN